MHDSRVEVSLKPVLTYVLRLEDRPGDFKHKTLKLQALDPETWG
jgi:hypothetical protein